MSSRNSKFFYYNLIDQRPTELVLVSGTPDSFYPLDNLKDHHTTKVFRTADASPAAVLIDCQTPSNADSFLIVGDSTRNLAVNAITIEANATADFSSPAFTTTVEDFDFEEGIATHFFETQRYRYWRVTFSPTSDYVEVANIFLGEALQLESQALTLGWEVQNHDTSKVSVTRYGQKFVDRVTDLKRIKGAIELMNPDEFEAVNTMFEYCGIHRPLWVVLDPMQVMSNNKDTFSGYFFLAKDRPAFTSPFHALYSTEFELEQAK